MNTFTIKKMVGVLTCMVFALALSTPLLTHAHDRGNDRHSRFVKSEYKDYQKSYDRHRSHFKRSRYEDHRDVGDRHKGFKKGKHKGHRKSRGKHKGFWNKWWNPWNWFYGKKDHDDDSDDDDGSGDDGSGDDGSGDDGSGDDGSGDDGSGDDGSGDTGVQVTITVHDHVINPNTTFTVTYNSLVTIQEVLTDLLGGMNVGNFLQECFETLDSNGTVTSSDCTPGETTDPLANNLTLEEAGIVDDPEVHLVQLL